VRSTVDDDAAHPADAFATVVVERDRLFVLGRELLVQHVQRLEEAHVLGDAVQLVTLEVALGLRVRLPPDVECDLHL